MLVFLELSPRFRNYCILFEASKTSQVMIKGRRPINWDDFDYIH